MTGEEIRYEVTEIKAIRGTEAKTITSKQQEGWELVTQQKGRLRTTMTFRRPKPKTPWRLWAALGGVAVVGVGIMTVGAILEDDSDASTTDAVAASNAEQSSPQPAPEREADPSSSADPMICDTKQIFGDPCKFGQTAIYSDTVRSGEVKLEITVGAPVEFTPSEDAIILYDRPLQPVSVYFPITIKNISPDSTNPTTVHTQAINAEQGEYGDIREVSDGDVGLRSVTSALSLPVNESLSVKEGWNMKTLEGVEYSLRIDGLAGYSIKFTR
ncbi:hypothetical protein OG921_24355 [Aldersonia sp. NBC_00410]|uniref:hypothetical protein n=1 Tax=Aldersonia sp. NBC_00410 TaxID=2975954 RepID=UPI0022527DDF|nr:hypothetical protein [Aldersonia sp. NBC_00410]MCX5044822.1 hypothetical protein [Aldersonia sp. NBC_00410]MCX5046309.1 hypothetical protein [Aldersonia sp. NBC_00410]